MTSVAEAIPVVELPFGLPYREVRGDTDLPSECAPDGYPLPFILDSPQCSAAVEVCRGEWAWFQVCEYIRGKVLSPTPPAGISVEPVGADGCCHLVTGPGGRMLVVRPIGNVRRVRSVKGWLRRQACPSGRRQP